MKQLKAQVYTDSDFPHHLFVRFHNGRIACARLIAADLNNKTYPLAAVIENNGEENEVHNYTSDGLATYGTLNDADLMIITEKEEGWVNVYKECDGERVERFVYKTEKEAFGNAEPDNYIATVKIEWEE